MCDETVPDEMLMCRSHWRQLTRSEQHQVWDSYHEHGSGIVHFTTIQPIIEALNARIAPPRNQGKPFGL
jgi:hypothetical protein